MTVDMLEGQGKYTWRLDPGVREVPVLDKGYVRLIDWMGDDLRVVNAAKASNAKRSEEFGPAEARLEKFLIRENHTSPFRHAMITLEFKAPLMVARQHWKYVVGSDHTMDGWNEGSRRYISSDEEFYLPKPTEWRSTPEKKKQGSGAAISADSGAVLTQALEELQDKALAYYHMAMEEFGVCAEEARLFLPAYGLYVNYWWTASLQSVIHFLNQRLVEDAQVEIQLYARAVHKLVQPKFPVAFADLVGT